MLETPASKECLGFYGSGKRVRRFSQPVIKTISSPTFQGSFNTFSSAIRNRTNSISSSRSKRSSKIADKRRSRTKLHLNNFIRLFVTVEQDVKFTIIADGRQTIEYLAQQIEAEYTFRYLVPDGLSTEYISPLGDRKEKVNPTKMVPLECGMLYNSSMASLRFTDLIADALSMDEQVKVSNLFEASRECAVAAINRFTGIDEEKGGQDEDGGMMLYKSMSDNQLNESSRDAIFDTMPSHTDNPYLSIPRRKFSSLQGIYPAKTIRHTANEIVTMDDRLQSVLCNKMALEAFLKFCVSDYTVENLLFYMDVEIFQTCTDVAEKILLTFYIYQLYIMENAPLKVNLTEEITGDISLPHWETMKHLDVTIYDDAQQYVYSSLKSHSFPRFTQTSAYESLVDASKNNINAYESLSLSMSFYEGFGLEIEVLQRAIQSLEASAPTESMSELSTGCNLSNSFKDMILHQTAARYFADIGMGLFEGYFDKIDRVTRAQKKKKIDREKKITKFFGEKPGEYRYSSNPALNVGAILDDESSSLGSKETVPLGHKSSSELTKKKQAKKLHGFFGEITFTKAFSRDDCRLDDNGGSSKKQQMNKSEGAVNMLGADKSSDTSASSSEEGSSKTHPSKTQPKVKSPLSQQERRRSKVNMISTKEKVEFTKRRNKLVNMMGENITDDVVYKTRGQATRQADPLESDIDIESISEDKIESLDAEIKRSISIIQSSPHRHREMQRKRLRKIQQYLGERITENDLIDAQIASCDIEKDEQFIRVQKQSATVEGNDQKKSSTEALVQQGMRNVNLKRNDKLGKMFGAAPPSEVMSEYGVHQSILEQHRASIAGLKMLWQRDETEEEQQGKDGELDEFVDKLIRISENVAHSEEEEEHDKEEKDEQQQGLGNPAMKGTLKKLAKRRKADKLRKFFGTGAVDSNALTEQVTVVEDIEKAIEDDMKNLLELKRNISDLRQQIRRQSMVAEGGPLGIGGLHDQLQTVQEQEEKLSRQGTKDQFENGTKGQQPEEVDVEGDDSDWSSHC